MSRLLNLNFVSDNVSSGFRYMVAYTVAGTLDEHTSVQSLRTRSVADAYIFTPSNTTKLIIEVGASTIEEYQCLGVLGSSLTEFSLYKGFYTAPSEMTIDETIVNKRSSLGNPNTYSDDSLSDSLAFFESDNVSSVWIFEFDVDAGVQYTIGAIWGSEYLDVKISPTSLKEEPVDTSESDYSNGGQKYVSTGDILNNIKFDIPVLTQSEAKGNTGSIKYINNTSGTAHPLIVIPYFGDNMMIYGTQKTLAKITPILAKDSTTEWKHKASMSIEEEL